MRIEDLLQTGTNEWEIPRGFRQDMRVAVRIFASQNLLSQVLRDRSLDQAVNATTLPGVVNPVVVMPDMHQGYGFPIGGVAATEYPDGVVSPGAIGYDINCGVRLLSSQLALDEAGAHLEELADRLNDYCPSGVGGSGAIAASSIQLEQILRLGSQWALKQGYATLGDLDRTEDGGRIADALPEHVSKRAKARGRTQIGSLGAGNHFLEVDVVDQVLDETTAAVFGLQRRCLAIQIHCGSRGLGHQVCTDYVQQFQSMATSGGAQPPDRELAWASMNSREGKAYLGAMSAAANFAFANRQVLAHAARKAFEDTYRPRTKHWELAQVYDVTHNMGKIEEHQVQERCIRVCVHRKGATRAFGPGFPGLPGELRDTGQPVLVPGSMGTASWVLAGAGESATRSLSSACHGAGRVWSRAKAKKEIRGEALIRELKSRGIVVRAGSLRGFAEEAPAAYKDVDEVVETVVAAGIAGKVARLRPLAVIKG